MTERATCAAGFLPGVPLGCLGKQAGKAPALAWSPPWQEPVPTNKGAGARPLCISGAISMEYYVAAFLGIMALAGVIFVQSFRRSGIERPRWGPF
jgi:hypothetical protein